MRLLRTIGIAAVLLSACSNGHAGSAAMPLLLPDVGPGFTASAVSGPLRASSLERATAIPAAVMQRYLQTVTLRAAGERVWTEADGSFVTDVVVRVGRPEQAARLVTTARDALTGPASRPFTLPDVPGGVGFVQTSAVHGRTMFCVIGVLAVSTDAAVLTRCAPTPQDTTALVRLVRAQREHLS